MLENRLCLSLDDKTGPTVQELALGKFIAHPHETFLRNKTAGQTCSSHNLLPTCKASVVLPASRRLSLFNQSMPHWAPMLIRSQKGVLRPNVLAYFHSENLPVVWTLMN